MSFYHLSSSSFEERKSIILPRSLQSADLDDLGFCSIRLPRQYFTSGVGDSDFLGERLRPKNPVPPVVELEPSSWLVPDWNQSKYPITNNPTPTSVMGICATGVNAAKVRIAMPAIVRLPGLRLMLGEGFLLGLRFGVVPENSSNAFGLLAWRDLSVAPMLMDS